MRASSHSHTDPPTLSCPARCAGPARRGNSALITGAGYMSALHSLKPGLSDEQAARQAAQREQLKRDLEEQMRAQREAKAARKAELAALEEREEAQLRAYWAAQARAAQGEAPPARPEVRAGDGQADDRAGRGAGQQGGKAWQMRQENDRPSQEGKAPSRGTASAALQSRPQSYMPPGVAGRGEALLQPGITVFLPPDKDAERRGALRARIAFQSYSEEAEAGSSSSQEQPAPGAVHHSSKHKPATPDSVAALQQALVQQAIAGGLLAAQQQQALQLLSPWLAASNPALAAAAGLPTAHPALPQLFMPLPATAAPIASSAAPATASSSSSNPQVLSMLRDLAAQQQHMREQLATQMEAVGRLAGDTTAARSERDHARLELERVQRMLAARQHAGGSGRGGLAAYGSPADEGMLSVTTHVLPLGTAIPSRLGTPAGKGAQPQRAPHGPSHAALPPRYLQQAPEPWQAQQQPRVSGAGRKASGRTGAAAAGGRADHAGALGGSSSSRGRAAGAAAKPAGPARGTWRK